MGESILFLRKVFPWAASAVIFASYLAVGYVMDQAAIKDIVVWMPYPAYTLVVISVFVAHWFIYRGEEA